jgi:endonuclease/exonuclease/phosphatase family metal-dependent hydrolase
MKNLLSLIAFLLLFFPGVHAQSQYPIVAIGFYNLENLFDPADDAKKLDNDLTPRGAYRYTDAIYKKKLHNLATVLSKIAVDEASDGLAIMGVAEVENKKVLQDLIKQPELKSRNYQIIHFESPDIRGIDVALLYRSTFFKVLKAQALPVVLKQKNKRIYTRDILYVKGILTNSDTVHIMVGHWPSRRGGEAASRWKRERAAEVCKAQLDSIVAVNPQAKVIIMGDLNDDPISPSVAKTLGATGDEKDLRAGGLFNPWWKYYSKGIGTSAYNDVWNLFDQIILSSGFMQQQQGWKFYKAEIFKRSFLMTQFGKYKGYPHRSFSGTTWIDGYSDHLPVYIYLVNNHPNKKSK